MLGWHQNTTYRVLPQGVPDTQVRIGHMGEHFGAVYVRPPRLAPQVHISFPAYRPTGILGAPKYAITVLCGINYPCQESEYSTTWMSARTAIWQHYRVGAEMVEKVT